MLLNFHSSFPSYPFGIACLITLLISVTQNPFTVYVETISANDRCVDICIDPQWVVKCNFDDDDDDDEENL